MCVCDTCLCDTCCVRANETSEERCEKKTEGTICLFVTSGFRTNKRRKRDTSVFIFNKRKRERERERTHALIITLDFLSSSSLICIKEIERKSG